jgi:hypothetical protein
VGLRAQGGALLVLHLDHAVELEVADRVREARERVEVDRLGVRTRTLARFLRGEVHLLAAVLRTPRLAGEADGLAHAEAGERRPDLVVEDVEHDGDAEALRQRQDLRERPALVVLEDEPLLRRGREPDEACREPPGRGGRVAVDAAPVHDHLVRAVEPEGLEEQRVVLELGHGVRDELRVRRAEHGELPGVGRDAHPVHEPADLGEPRRQLVPPAERVGRVRAERHRLRRDAEDLDAVLAVPAEDRFERVQVGEDELAHPRVADVREPQRAARGGQPRVHARVADPHGHVPSSSGGR